MSINPQCIIILGLQFSGKSTLGQHLTRLLKIPFISLDQVRLALFGYLSVPRDWQNPLLKAEKDKETKHAYDCLFFIMKIFLSNGISCIVEMPYLGPRESQLEKLMSTNSAKLKLIWCEIGKNEKEEIKKRAKARKADKLSAQLRSVDYWLFKSREVYRPKLQYCFVDTSRSVESCLRKISQYIKT